jgi:hypothetical protein
MTHSEQLTDLLTALCAARLEFPVITRNREGFSKRTGQKYQYADLNAIIDGTVPILGQHGLLLVQSLEDGEGGTLMITSTLFHAASGQWVSSELSVIKPDNMQDFGSVATYAKRYAQQALLNVSTEDDDDAASLNGSSKAEKSAAAVNGRPSKPVSANGHAPEPGPDASLEHPTESHLAALKNLACTECGDPVEVYEDRLRRTMGIPKHASVSPRLLSKSMSMQAYMEVYGFYRRLEEQLAKGKETPSANHSPSQPSSQPTPPPTGEGPTASPSPDASTSAGSDPADAAERERIVREAMDAGIAEKEARHIVTHHALKAAHSLLLAAAKKRLQAA